MCNVNFEYTHSRQLKMLFFSSFVFSVVASAGNDSIDVSNKSVLNNFLKKKYAEEGKTFNGGGIEAPGELPGVVTVYNAVK
ncbi:hypothetical protein [Peribacillus phoenicis]|uniref:hypothetical protein n=2 Tax=unclassified Peribacillus TaxID=2675266 RepID=UPI0039A672FF